MGEDMIEAQESEAEGDEELRLWLKGYVESHPHHSTAVLSRAQHIGVSRRALDSYLAGAYFLPKEYGGEGVDARASKVENMIRAYRERVEGTNRHGYTNEFTETRTWSVIRQACQTAVDEHSIVVVCGRPGVGKSRCLMEFAARSLATAPITILCSANVTTRYFVQRLARELKLDDRPPTAQLEDRVAEKLRRYPRPLIVDQANYLNEKGLGAVCHVWEVARIPIILAGTRALHEKFSTSRMTEEVREQLSSRVALYYLLPELSLAEAKAIIARSLGEEATDEVVAQVFNVTGGVYRHVDMILPRIRQLTEKNSQALFEGQVKMIQLIALAGARLMVG